MLTFSQKKAFLYFGKWNFLRKRLIFLQGTFRDQKIKKINPAKISHIFSKKFFLIFQQMELSSSKFKKLL